MTIIKIISCGVFKPEIEKLITGREDMEAIFLEQGLHVRPENLKVEVQKALAAAEKGADEIRLAYGLCANGTLGVKAGCAMAQPRCHDCIPILLGSQERYQELHAQNPGTLYLSAGWLDSGGDPLSIIHNVYAPRLGMEKSVWGMKKELENYNRLALILTGLADSEMKAYRERVQENAAFLEKNYVEIEGGPGLLAQLLAGPQSGIDFITLEPGQVTEMKDFIEGY